MNLWPAYKEAAASLEPEVKAKAKLGCFTILSAPLLMVWKALAFKILWAWFVVPVFGLPVLSIPVAIGLGLVLEGLQGFKLVTKSKAELEQYTLAEIRQNLVSAWLLPAIALLVGRILKAFI
jgi:hypothetical protein